MDNNNEKIIITYKQAHALMTLLDYQDEYEILCCSICGDMPFVYMISEELYPWIYQHEISGRDDRILENL